MKGIVVLSLFCLLALTISKAIITDYVLQKASLNGKTNIMLVLNEQINFQTLTTKSGVNVHNIKNHDERGYFVMNTLMQQQKVSQKSIIQYLKRNGLTYRSYWISNTIYVDNVNEQQINEISERTDIRLINTNEEFQVDLEKPTKEVVRPKNETEWNVKWINADKVWELGFEGKGIITGVSDTGVVHSHPALINSYRGKKENGEVDHSYSWLEPYTSAREPNDANGHGTHCVGTVCGGVDRKIGVAPQGKIYFLKN
jgi:subtilisin family serine protease